MKVLTVAQMVGAERLADAGGLSYGEMMENAGILLAKAIQNKLNIQNKTITILVGTGNNGGDGLVAGWHLAQAGANVSFYLFKERNAETDVNMARVVESGLPTLVFAFDRQQRVLRHRLGISDVIVDALLGTGVSRPIKGELAKLMRVAGGVIAERAKVRESSKLTAIDDFSRGKSLKSLVVAVDCPSGLNCDTGALDGLAMPADLTVTFAAPKRGHFIFPGAGACGTLVVADIGIDEKYVAGADVEVMTRAVGEKMPARPLDGHKGTFGKALICAGQAQYWGAPFLSGLGALRAGAGLVSLAIPSSIRATIAGQLPEATYPPMPNGETLGQESVDFLLANGMGKVKAVLVGPGLGEADEFVWGMIEALTPNPSPEGRGGQALPSLVVDADGLNALARVDRWWEKMPAFSILTPHPGEMARLCGEEIGDTDRVELARKMAQKWGQIVVLKGAYTVVASPDGEVVLSPFANPILGVGGSGDVLAGVIVSLLAQGCAPFVAAQLGVYWHGAVGVYLANERGWNAGILAHEFANALPTIINRISP